MRMIETHAKRASKHRDYWVIRESRAHHTKPAVRFVVQHTPRPLSTDEHFQRGRIVLHPSGLQLDRRVGNFCRVTPNAFGLPTHTTRR